MTDYFFMRIAFHCITAGADGMLSGGNIRQNGRIDFPVWDTVDEITPYVRHG
jgi:hypothetical protein